MVAGYTRQAAANIQPGLRCNAEDVNAEYNQLANAFDNTNGHDHSGSVAGDAAKISLSASVTGVLPVANGGTGTSSGSGGPFLPLSGGTLTGGLTGTTVTWTGASSAASVTANAASGTTAFYAPNGNLVLGGAITVTGMTSPTSNVSILATNAVEANFNGTAFYAPNGSFVGVQANLSGTGSAVLNCTSGACSATAFNVVSDAALKTDVSDHAFGLAHILALAPKSYRRVAAPERLEAGLLAQEVAAILPHAVVEIPGVPVDPLAADAAPGAAVLALDYVAVTVALVNAVKGLAAQVEALQAKVGG